MQGQESGNLTTEQFSARRERKEMLDNLLLKAVNETLREVFKDAGAEAIYNFMEKRNLKREEIAEKPEDFSAGLEMLMASAAPIIEKTILEKLHSELELRFEEKEGYEFLDYACARDYVKKLRRKYKC